MSNKIICCAWLAIVANIAVAQGQLQYYMLLTAALICFITVLYLLNRIKLFFVIIIVMTWGIFSLGRYYVDNHNITAISAQYGEENVTVEGMIHSPFERDGDRISFELKVEQLNIQGNTLKLSEKLLVQLYLTEQAEIELSERYERGQHIVASGKLKEPSHAQNFDAFDYKQFLNQKQIHWSLQINGLTNIEIKQNAEKRLNYVILHAFDTFRSKLYAPFATLFDGEHAGYLGGLVFGMKTELDPELFQSFSHLGLTHILAVSGLHVAVVVACLMFVFKLIKLPRSIAYTTTIAILPCYVMVTGAQPSIIRAGIMAMIGLWLLKHHKLKNTSSILAIAAMLMILINPLILYSIGFQLSFLVTFGLLIYTPLIRQSITLKKSKLADAIAVTVSAQLTSFPLTIYYFNQFNPLSFLANFILVPYISFFILPLATFTNLLAHISIYFAKPFAALTVMGNKISFYIIEQLNKWSSLNLIWKSPSLIWILAWYITIFILLNKLSQLKNIQNILQTQSKHHFKLHQFQKNIIVMCLCISLLLVYAYQPSYFNFQKRGSISYISVGQGDSILIQTPSNKTILVDSGGQLPFQTKDSWAERSDPFDVGKDIVVPLLKKRGIKHLDIVVISHFDADHFLGFNAVLDEIIVKQVWFNGTIKEEKEVGALLNKIKMKNIPIIAMHQGDHIKLDKHTSIDVLWPMEQSLRYEAKQNSHSIVLLLNMFEYHFLLTGDIDATTEKDITTYMYKHYKEHKQIEILKLAHHGSKYSTSPHLLSYFSPKLAIASVGKNNRYGHPHPDVEQRLRLYGTPLLRTDEQGEIMFHIKENQIQYIKWNNYNSFY